MNAQSDDAGAPRTRYQLILTGELIPGHGLDEAVRTLAEVFMTPPAELRELFDGSVHRVEQEFSADEALELQDRLQRAGVRARIEKAAQRQVPLVPRNGVSHGTTRGAAIGSNEPTLARVAEHRGPYTPAAARPSTPPPETPVAAPSPQTPPPQPRAKSSHAEKSWRDAWADSHVVDEPDEDERLALFVGPGGPRYVGKFAGVRQGTRPVLKPSWNWGVVPSPFLWALYRKLWGWALVIGLTEVVVPLAMLVLASHEVVGGQFATLAYLLMIGNRLFWPVVANYLYFRHAQGTLLQLFRLSPGYASDLDVAEAGGVSRGAVLVGAAFTGVLALFLWSLVSSVTEPPLEPFEARVSELSQRHDLGNVQTPGQIKDISDGQVKEESRWGITRRQLRELGQVVNEWVTRRAVNKDPSQLTLFRLREEMNVPTEALQDGWGGEIHYVPDTEGFRLISAGQDRLFGTADDIQYRRMLEH